MSQVFKTYTLTPKRVTIVIRLDVKLKTKDNKPGVFNLGTFSTAECKATDDFGHKLFKIR